MPNCTEELFTYQAFDRRKIEASFTGGEVSNDGGVMLLRQADKKLGLIAELDKAIKDPRNPKAHSTAKCISAIAGSEDIV